MSVIADKFYAITDKGPLRALSLVLALVMAGCVFWHPAKFASQTSNLAVWQGIVLIWAVCSGIVHGLGFRPASSLWKTLFSPLLAAVILIAGLVYFFT
ncbi:MAG: cyd operon protein YbgE [Rouxiella aceris]|uniref:cyd operon protein YbgE n=1 Tax=Rouxiella aceris TaxID=2703884 RepID=UPI0028400038|nr:cyd operon protein YbgE [Rouxiella aceris]MDR3431714.1 cyd operon protein YbgE [Rouxiella aceris]